MNNIKKRYSWVKIENVKKEDKDLFLKMFYLKDIPCRKGNENLEVPYIYEKVAKEIVKAHYNENLSREFYREFKKKKRLFKSSKKREIDPKYLKIIGPIILVIILLLFVSWIYKYNII
ncbi:MAG: hypothetical protein ACQEQE_10930 [Bacillota bacterium]